MTYRPTTYSPDQWRSVLERLHLTDEADVFWMSPDPAIDDEALDFRTSSY